MKLQFTNYSRFSRPTRGTRVYAWCVFLKAPPNVIDAIEMIEYTLHPTFPNPVREIFDREHAFALQSEGWGVFGIDIRVFFRDGTEQEAQYALKLSEDDWPRGPTPKNYDTPNDKLVYDVLLEPKWEWRKFSTIVDKTAAPPAEVSEILERLAAGGYVRKAYFRSIDNQELWGATSRVGILPTPGRS